MRRGYWDGPGSSVSLKEWPVEVLAAPESIRAWALRLLPPDSMVTRLVMSREVCCPSEVE